MTLYSDLFNGIFAEVWSDDHRVVRSFNAHKWFQQASVDEIEDLACCSFLGDYPADAVAMFMADHDQQVAEVFKYIELVKTQEDGDTMGFECAVSPQDAAAWIANNRPALHAKLSQNEDVDVYPKPLQVRYYRMWDNALGDTDTIYLPNDTKEHLYNDAIIAQVGMIDWKTAPRIVGLYSSTQAAEEEK